MADHWWRDAVIYAVDVDRFCDGNGDGIGDFKGLISKVPYLTSLGVTCIWLLPFFPSTNRDNGYDITDYLRIDTRYGEFADFLDFMRSAGEHGIRVIIDLVAHHTSFEHPWFQSARYDQRSPFRDYYVWSEHPPAPPPGKASIFPGQEDSVWTFDEIARSYYYHRFYHFQPGLNHQNRAVWREIERITDFWMSFGISGFRIDAASHMIERPLHPEGRVDQSHEILRHIYGHITERMPDAVVLGEVDENESKLPDFFDGRQLNMLFNFFLDNYLLLALATDNADPIREAVAKLPPPPPNGQWANFLRNLDEADLERLPPEKMAVVLDAFAPDEGMRIFGRGIRRRLAPMLGGDAGRLKLAYSLLFSMPGSPVICYGDEIGMGDDLSQQGRNAVRTPMQWNSGPNGGFSSAKRGQLTLPVVEDGPFSAKRVNVEEQSGRESSLLSLIKRLVQIRRTHRAIGAHDLHLLKGAPDQVLAHGYHAPDHELVMLHNLAAKPVKVEIEIDAVSSGTPTPLVGDPVQGPEKGILRVALQARDFRWFKWSR